MLFANAAGEMSVGNYKLATVSGEISQWGWMSFGFSNMWKRHWGKCHWGEMSMGEISFGEMSVGEMLSNYVMHALGKFFYSKNTLLAMIRSR